MEEASAGWGGSITLARTGPGLSWRRPGRKGTPPHECLAVVWIAPTEGSGRRRALTAPHTLHTLADDGRAVLAVTPKEGLRIQVTWVGRDAAPETIDLAPALFRDKLDGQLRDDPDLFRTVRFTDDGVAVGWDCDDRDMASTTIPDPAEQVVPSADVAAFIRQIGRARA